MSILYEFFLPVENGGAIFIFSWNASVVAAARGNFFKTKVILLLIRLVEVYVTQALFS